MSPLERLAWALLEVLDRVQSRALTVAGDPSVPLWRRRWALRYCGHWDLARKMEAQ